MAGTPTPNDSTRLAQPANSTEQALEDGVRAILDAADWTAPQTKHLLDSLLLVHRYGREVMV